MKSIIGDCYRFVHLFHQFFQMLCQLVSSVEMKGQIRVQVRGVDGGAQDNLHVSAVFD